MIDGLVYACKLGSKSNLNQIHAMSGYTEDAVRGAMKLWTYSSWLRPLAALWLPELKAVRGHIKTAEE